MTAKMRYLQKHLRDTGSRLNTVSNGTIRILSSVRQQWRHGRTIITGWLICGLNIFNGKAAAFTLYQEIQSGQRYLVDARIQEDGQTTILMDYMAVLEPDDIRVTEFGVGTDVSIYKPLTYQDPSRDSAFPYNLPDVAEVFLLKVQGSSAAIENNCADISDDFTEILAGLLADKALDRLERGLGMEMYQTDQGDLNVNMEHI